MLVVSIAVISSRVENIPEILSNLEHQTRPPDKVILNFSAEPWHLDRGIPYFESPKTHLSVEVVKVPNRGSCRKYLWSAERYRHTDASILLLDDDFVFDSSLIERLHDHQNEHRRVVGTRGWSEFNIEKDENNEKVFRRSNSAVVIGSHVTLPTEVVVTSSGWATMFYARDVDELLFNRELQDSVQLGYSDEVFLAAMLPRKKFVIPMPPDFQKKLPIQESLKSSPQTPYAKALQAELLDPEILANARVRFKALHQEM